jgi:hypothetical protein
MADSAELLQCLNNPDIDNWQRLSIGANAMWDAGFGNASRDTLETARAILERIVETDEVSNLSRYYSARIQMAQIPIFEKWADEESITVESMVQMNQELAPILEDLLDSGRFFSQVVGVTYQLLLGRLEDPYHVALASTPEAERDSWVGSDGVTYPRCNRIVTSLHNELIPSVVVPRLHPDELERVSGVQYLGLGYELGVGAMRQNVPGIAKEIEAQKGWAMRGDLAIRATASYLTQEAAEIALTKPQENYLDSEGRFLVDKIELVPRSYTR